MLCVSETWLYPYIPDSHVHISGYHIYRCDKGKGGGTCIYVKDNLTSKVITGNIIRPNGIEDVWVSIQSRKLPSIIIGSIYRHPKTPQETFEYLNEILKNMCLRNKGLYVLGDLNDNLLSSSNKLDAIFSTNKLHQIVDKPTRVTQQSATLLDIIATNKHDTVIYKDVIPNIIADHDLITATVNITKPKRKTVTKTFRHLGAYSNDALCNALLTETPTLSKISQTDDVDTQVNILTSTFTNCLDKCAPLVTQEIKRPPAPWINDDIRSAMAIRNTLQWRLKLDRNNVTLEEQYKNERNKVKSLLRNAEQEYYRDQLHNNKGNTAATWKIIKNIVPNKKSTANINLESENELERAEEFNELFIDVGKRTFEKTQNNLNIINFNYENPERTENHENFFRAEPVDVNTVILTIKHLKNTNSTGSDGIALRYINDSLPVIINYITTIINTSIVTGTFPSLWKHATVIPIFKNGDRNDINNYRPISLLPILSKVLEKIVAQQLTTYLEANKLLSNSQYGFRPKLSTESALTTVTNKLYTNMDNKKISLITLCDLSKAFDSVHHEILMQKLAKVKVDSFWFRHYVLDRTQSVKINTTLSKTARINFGVPQGSILGPILFTIFVNDLTEIIQGCEVIQYADDTQFVHTGTTDELPDLIMRAETTLSHVKAYFNRNGLMINPNKTQCLFVGTRPFIRRIPADTIINFDNALITPSKHIKNLGIYMDCHMTFDVHIQEMRKKVMGILFFLNRIKDKFDFDTRKTVIQSLALSIINYCLPVYGTTNSTLLQRVQKLQNFAAKICVGGARRSDHATPFILQLEWLKIEKKIIFEAAINVYKIKNKLFPDWFMQFPTNNDISHNRYTTRQQHNLYVSHTNTDHGGRSLSVLGPKIWNTLPDNVTNSLTLQVFRKRLKEFLMNNNVPIH